MGSVIRPVCKCNSNFPSLYAGGGFSDWKDVCNVPTPCFHCQTIFTRNLYNKILRCPKCRKVVHPYGEVVDFNNDMDKVFSWSFQFNKKYQLLSKKFRCPVCKEEELSFIREAMWN
jgi:predicted RNA-binding Zn-ribbon protein involved in translation (DUF1610 family)